MTTETQIPHPDVVSPSEWRAKRLELLALEKEATKFNDKVSAARRRLPMVKVEKEYVFDTPEGKKTLRDLFGDKHQLVVYHFMFDPNSEEGCPGCTGYVNEIGDQTHLGTRDTAFLLISRAPLEKLEAYKKKHGWDKAWVSSFGSDFNYDYHVTLDESKAPLEYNYRSKAEWEAVGKDTGFMKGEEHGTSVFFRVGEDVYHTYSSYGRGTEGTTDSYGLLDLTPYGRQEDWEDSPAGWPQRPTYG